MNQANERIDRWQNERRVFSDFLEAVAAIPDLVPAEKQALAFIVDDTTKKNPAGWEEDVAAFRNALLMVSQDLPELTWKLAQEFNARYEAFLQELLSQEKDDTRKGNLALLMARLASDFKIRRETYNSRQRVPIGSIIQEHIPPWFAE